MALDQRPRIGLNQITLCYVVIHVDFPVVSAEVVPHLRSNE